MCACQVKRKAEADQGRPSAQARGYDSKWQRESKAFLALPENSRCACGCDRIANMVDHIQAHKGDKRLFWSRSNWQPMASSPCHNSRKQSLERRANNRNAQ
jgi:5-methylcytosine-specific restriction protein A